MSRFVIGLIVGAIGAAAIYALNMSALTLLAPLVAMACGLLLGALLGWRNPHPRGALVSGLLTGALAGVLMGVGQLSGVARVVHFAQVPVWMRDIPPYSAMYGWLTSGMGGLLALLTALVAGFFAGLLSAWTGFRMPAMPAWSPTPDDVMSLLPGPPEQ